MNVKFVSRKPLVLHLPAVVFNVGLQGGEEAFGATSNYSKIPNRF